VTDESEFARWLRERLAARRMSQRQLAQRSGVDHTTVSRLARGGRHPSHQTALRLRAVLEGPGLDPAGLAATLHRDPYLTEADIERVVDLYIAVRAQRARTVIAGAEARRGFTHDGRAIAGAAMAPGRARRRS
jgi:transcriptional regulator with XRE-family HTH domain